MELQENISYEYNLSRVGTEEEVIVDRWEDGVLVCRSRQESPDVDGEILVKSSEDLTGSIVKVKIVGADSYDLAAELI